MSKTKIEKTKIIRSNQSVFQEDMDSLAVEEPLEIRVNGNSIAVTMRTPGNDEELSIGFLFTEGIIKDKKDLGLINYCKSVPEEASQNILNIYLRKSASFNPDKVKRNFYASSSCGI